MINLFFTLQSLQQSVGSLKEELTENTALGFRLKVKMKMETTIKLSTFWFLTLVRNPPLLSESETRSSLMFTTHIH